MAKPIPTNHIGKYQIMDLVGEGAMGSVYRALDPVLNRTVAVKVMSESIARDSELRDRFMREAQAAGSLQHPNVVTIFDFGEFEGHLYIAMEFVVGVDLEELLAKGPQLTLDQKLGIAIDVLLGLAYAHKHGVVHRDIKPANIRLTEDGRAKIMDFGVAHLDSAKMTRTGVMLGTPNYMAPEQVVGQPIGPATDIFSLGAVLYEMLTGKKAFGADSMHSVLFKVVSEDPPPLAIAAPDVPTELEPIVQMSLLKDAHERYQSASEMANDLTAARGLIAGRDPSESISLSATLAPHVRRVAAARLDPAKRVVRARWIVFAAAIVAAVALVSGTYAYTKYASRSMDIVAAPREPALPLRNAVTDSNVERLPAAAPNDTVVVPSAPKPITGERDIVREVRRAAIAERAGALKSGITASALAGGDTQLARADRLAAAGKLPDAVQALNAATLAWREAARSSTASAPLNPAPSLRTTPPDSTRLPASLPPPIVTQRREAEVVLPPVRRPDSVQSSATTGASASDATREILTLIAEWGAALESRDISRLRTLYPSITPQQTERFDQFFHAVRSLKASLDAGTPEVNGNVGSTRVSGTYQFVDLNGKSQRQPASFVATLQRDGSTWRIRSIQ